ncbi:MAG: leucine-rich repeat protein [Oscillospiraceae bacterium]|nr:leucine-rich repeat protein [Oscillospiraceae bacterium]
MKSTYRKMISIILSAVMVFTIVPLAQLSISANFAEGGFQYTVSDGNATVTGYTGSGGNVIIPDKLGGYPVTVIGERAFWWNHNITNVLIPEGVITIGDWAFAVCWNLANINIPESVKVIGHSAFSSTAITSITIPNGVVSIGSGAFYGTNITDVYIPESVTFIGPTAFEISYYLIDITVSENNPNYLSENGVLFNKDKTVLLQYPIGRSDETYIIPDTVILIEPYAFAAAVFTDIIIPDSVITIEYGAFAYCYQLTNITIGENVKTIGGAAFNNCKSLLEMVIPDSVITIGSDAFIECSDLTKVTIGSNVTSIGHNAFEYCVSLKEIIIPDSVVFLGEGAFKYCRSLTDLTIGNGITEIYMSTFGGCDSLKKVIIPETVTSIERDNFYSSMKDLVIYCYEDSYAHNFAVQNNLNFVLMEKPVVQPDFQYDVWCEQAIITGYTGLGGDVVIPAELDGYTVTAIGDLVFQNRHDITSVSMPETVNSIGSYAFQNCHNLESINIPDGLVSIGNYTFQNCYALESLSIPESVTSIGIYTFDACYNLTVYCSYNSAAHIYAEDNGINYVLLDIDFEYIIENCGITITKYYGANLHVNIPAFINGYLVTAIGDYAFQNRFDIKSVIIPSRVTSIGNYAFQNCHSLESIKLPDNIISIGYYAFQNCHSLVFMDIPSVNLASVGLNAFLDCNTDLVINGFSGSYAERYANNNNIDFSVVYLAGNPTGTGSITVADIIAVRNHILGSMPLCQDALSAADINKDGIVNIFDMISIRNVILNRAESV